MDRAGGKSLLPEGKSPSLHQCWVEVSAPQISESNPVDETPILFLSNEKTHSTHQVDAQLDNFKVEEDTPSSPVKMFVELPAAESPDETFQAIIQDDTVLVGVEAQELGDLVPITEVPDSGCRWIERDSAEKVLEVAAPSVEDFVQEFTSGVQALVYETTLNSGDHPYVNADTSAIPLRTPEPQNSFRITRRMFRRAHRTLPTTGQTSHDSEELACGCFPLRKILSYFLK